jgi:tetratricopeptide (TPR) repeat protein
MPDDLSFSAVVAAAQGYCELRMWKEAWNDLKALAPEERERKEILRLRLGILIGMERWDIAATLAEEMVDKGCRDHSAFLMGAYAMRRSRSLREALEFLVGGSPFMADDATFWYSRACYECQLGDRAAAKRSLEKAFTLNPDLRLQALEEEDLTPLWNLNAAPEFPPQAVTTKERALEIATAHNAGRPLPSATVQESLPSNCFVYGGLPDCWIITCLYDGPPRLQSSRLIAVSKNTGMIMYDGDASDEG